MTVNEVLELTIANHRHAPNPVFVQAILADLSAAGLEVVPKDDALWLRALNAAGVDNWQGIDHAIDLRDEMLADAR